MPESMDSISNSLVAVKTYGLPELRVYIGMNILDSVIHSLEFHVEVLEKRIEAVVEDGTSETLFSGDIQEWRDQIRIKRSIIKAFKEPM